MTDTEDADALSNRRYAVLLIRVLVDPHNRPLSGEVGGPDEYGGPQRWIRFRGPSGLLTAVERWLAEQPSLSSDV
jgi:hypothetical protein